LLTDCESCSEASTFEEYFEEEEEVQEQEQQQASAEFETQAATSGGLPNWGPPQRRNTNIHHFVVPAKGLKKVRPTHQHRQLATV
jgi:hypothetical protein